MTRQAGTQVFLEHKTFNDLSKVQRRQKIHTQAQIQMEGNHHERIKIIMVRKSKWTEEVTEAKTDEELRTCKYRERERDISFMKKHVASEKFLVIQMSNEIQDVASATLNYKKITRSLNAELSLLMVFLPSCTLPNTNG